MFIIKKACISDANDILDIAKTTFSETFLEHNTIENLNFYLNTNLTSDIIESQIQNSNSIFYLAKKENDIVGYLKLNFAAAQTELQDEQSLEIERIYVLKSYHGQKIGQALINKAIAVAKESKLQYIWLGVWENNSKGINFYKNNGFKTFDKHVFMIGNDAQTDFLMKLNF